MATGAGRANAARSLSLVIAAAAVSYACQSSPGTPGGAPMCIYGQELECGPAKQCISTCLPDLSAFGPCMCGDAGADAGDGGKRDAR